MAAQTYLEIVNTALAESKASLDPLSSSDFSSPPRTVLYNHFKRWVNTAYRELCMKRKEWQFRSERATVKIWPRLHLSGLTYTPSVGDVLVGQSSGVQFTVKIVHSYEDVDGDAAVERTVSVEFDDDSNPSNLIIRENIDRVSPSAATDVGYYKAAGRYNFAAEITGLETLKMNTVELTLIPEDAATGGNTSFRIIPLSQEQWRPEFYEMPWDGWAYPKYIVEQDDGNYDLYPKPREDYYLSFDFTRKITPMSVHSDTPEGLPEEYHDYLMWRTVQEYADWNRDSELFMRAKKHVEDYLYWLDRDEKQKPAVVGCLFRA